MTHRASTCWGAAKADAVQVGQVHQPAFTRVAVIGLYEHSAFAPGSVAQTSVARVNGIIVNTGTNDTPCFHLLFDRASAHYLWHVLIDAMQEFDGAPAGIKALPASPR